MSQSEQLMKIANGVVNFCGEMKLYLENTKESIDTVLNRHYQANHTPYAVMSFEDEAHYWEEQLAYPINKVIRPTDSDDEYLSRVAVLRNNSYVIIRGNLKSGRTIRYDETKYQQLYINGERYTVDYTFHGETPETYERLTVFIVQTPYNITTREWGELIVDVADFPIEHAEIYANIGTVSRIQPNIQKLLETDTVESLYVIGDWFWGSVKSVIKELSVTGVLTYSTFNCFRLEKLHLPNTSGVPLVPQPKGIKSLDLSNATGVVANSAFHSSEIRGTLVLNKINEVGLSAFNGTYFNRVFLGNTLTRIGENGFAWNSALTEVRLPDSLVDMGMTAFTNNRGLKVVVIGNGLKYLSANCFNKCTSLEEVTLGKSLINFQSVNNQPFNGCEAIKILKVAKGYHCPTTLLTVTKVLDWRCFLEILENCDGVGEDDRTAETMTFRVNDAVRTELTNAYIAGDETALAIYELIDSKRISITT